MNCVGYIYIYMKVNEIYLFYEMIAKRTTVILVVCSYIYLKIYGTMGVNWFNMNYVGYIYIYY